MKTLNLSNLRQSVKSLALVATLAAVVQSTTVQADPKFLNDGVKLVQQIQLAQSHGTFSTNGVELNRYGGKWKDTVDPSYIAIGNYTSGILSSNNTTCAPLVTHLLKNAYNWNWSKYSFYDSILGKTTNSASPSAYRYVALIEQKSGFNFQAAGLDEVLPGDIMAIHYLGTTDGHVMTVRSIDWTSAKTYPTLPDSDPDLIGSTYFEMEVLDSSNFYHTDDTRLVQYNGATIQTHGVGLGVIGVLVNADFEVLGYTWSLPDADFGTDTARWLTQFHARLELQADHKVVFGRLPVN